jgi:hypothetical protein
LRNLPCFSRDLSFRLERTSLRGAQDAESRDPPSGPPVIPNGAQRS